jgi:hypothetical protein
VIAIEVEWEEAKDLIESMVPPEKLIGRSLDILAGAVVVEKLKDRMEFGTAYTHTPEEEKEIVDKIINFGEASS